MTSLDPHHQRRPYVAGRRCVALLLGALLAALVVALAPPALLRTALASPSGTAAAADDADVVTWGVRPAESDDPDEAERANFVFRATAGTTIRDSFVVTNHDDAPIVLDVYGADAFMTPDGQLDALPAGEESTQLGAWIDVDRGSLRMPAGASRTVDFTVTVPDAVEPGDYSAAVITSLRTGDAATGIAVDRRLGIRMHLRVDGELEPAVAVSDLAVDYDTSWNPLGRGDATVSYTLTNTGNVRVTTEHRVEISGPFGMLTVAAPATEDGELLPGSSRSHTATVEGVVPLFRSQARVDVEPTVVPVPGESTLSGPHEIAEEAFATVPWATLGAIAVLLLVWLAARYVRRRNKRREDERVATAVAEALAASSGRDVMEVGRPGDRLS
jgi:hypothetical protein